LRGGDFYRDSNALHFLEEPLRLSCVSGRFRSPPLQGDPISGTMKFLEVDKSTGNPVSAGLLVKVTLGCGCPPLGKKMKRLDRQR
jgi:hypothetical protein